MALKKVYKNVFFDTEQRQYFFINGDNKKPVVDEQAYLLIYIIELLQRRDLK